MMPAEEGSIPFGHLQIIAKGPRSNEVEIHIDGRKLENYQQFAFLTGAGHFNTVLLQGGVYPSRQERDAAEEAFFCRVWKVWRRRVRFAAEWVLGIERRESRG